MKKQVVYIGIVILAVIAMVLGYKIYQQHINLPQASKSGGNPEATGSSQVSSEIAPVLTFPLPNASEQERKRHSDLVSKLGNEFGRTPFLDISGCKSNPIVYRVKQGASFKVKNSDAVDRTIYTDRRTTIKASSEQTLSSKDIGDNLGNYGYGCDNSSGPVGIIQITP